MFSIPSCRPKKCLQYVLKICWDDEEIFITWRITYKRQDVDHCTPSTSALGMSTSGAREASIRAFPRMRLSDNLPKSWKKCVFSSWLRHFPWISFLMPSKMRKPLYIGKMRRSEISFITLPVIVWQVLVGGTNERQNGHKLTIISFFYFFDFLP